MEAHVAIVTVAVVSLWSGALLACLALSRVDGGRYRSDAWTSLVAWSSLALLALVSLAALVEGAP